MTDTARLPPLLTTRDAAERIGVSTATIKRWTDSGVLKCERTPGGHRKFRATEVERLAHSLRGMTSEDPPKIEVDAVRRLALAGDTVALYALAEGWVNSERGLDALFDTVFAPALAEVGECWADGTATVADEHTASSVVGEVVTRMAAFVEHGAPHGTAISACLAGEHHGLASRMAGLILREAGYHALVPGPDTPDDALLSLIASSDARVVCLSASCLFQGDERLPVRVEPIRSLLDARGARLFVGGQGFALPSFAITGPSRFLLDMRSLSSALQALVPS